jgi:hypothetical protein
MTSRIDRLFQVEELSPGLVSLVIAAVLGALYWSNPDVHAHFGEWESSFYIRTVLHPLQSPIDPHYGYRLLPALLVRVMPFDMKLSYLLINYACLFGAAFVLYKILVFESIRPVFALWACIVFLIAKASTKFLLTYSSGQDALFLLLMALGYHLIQLERWKSFVIVLCVGVLNKAAILALFVPVLVYGSSFNGSSFSSILRNIANRSTLLLLPLLVFVGIRLAYPPADTGYTFARDVLSHLNLKFFVGSQINASLPHLIEVPIAFYVVYGMIAVVMLFFARDVWGIAKRNLPISVYFLTLSAITFMGSYDNARCAVYVFIPVLYVCCSIMERNDAFFRSWYVLIPLISIQIYNSNLFNLNPADYEAYMPHYMTADQAIGYFYVFVLSVGLMATCRLIYSREQRRGATAG